MELVRAREARRGTPSCLHHHMGVVLLGRMEIETDDGARRVVGPGEVFNIPPGHDAHVVGDEPVVGIELQIRAGVHSGEVERQAGNVRGVAVHAATRIASLAQPGDILVSAPAAGLLEGPGLSLEDAGEHELKGLPGRRRVYRLADGEPS